MLMVFGSESVLFKVFWSIDTVMGTRIYIHQTKERIMIKR